MGSKPSARSTKSTTETSETKRSSKGTSVNRVILVGRLVVTPELRTTASGIHVTTVRIATIDREQPEIYDVVLWRQLADFAAKYMTRGRLAYAEGRQQRRTWEAADGSKRRTVEVVVDRFQAVAPKQVAENVAWRSRGSGGCLPRLPLLFAHLVAGPTCIVGASTSHDGNPTTMPTLESETIALGQLFSQKFFFRVPEYQRPFLWDADNLSDLVDDLVDAPRDREYFLGTLVLHDRGDSNYDIVDGQQRLTALCVLLACVRDCDALDGDTTFQNQIHEKVVQPAKELDGVPEKDRVQVRDQGIFNAMVAAQGGTRDTPDARAIKSPSEKRYELAREIFRSKVNELTLEDLKEFAAFLSQRCVMIYLATTNFDDAFRLFTIVNDRGKQLRRIDILKAINLDPAIVTNENARTRYAHEWEAMEDRLGETHFEEIFHSLRLIYVQDKPQADLQKEFTERIYGKPGMPKVGKDFLDTLAGYTNLYDAIFLARDYLEDTPDHRRFKPLMAAMVSEFGASEWKACLLYFAKKFGPERFLDYVLAIEKVYLEHWVGAMRKDERYSRYTTLLASIKTLDDPGAVLDAVTSDEESVRDACRQDNFYSAGYSKYLLLRAEILASELDQDKEFVVRSVEHVLPQNPKADSEWRKSFSDDDIKAVVHTAGNLVLLSKGKNSAASNREFPAKKETYLKKRVSDFPRSVEILGFDEWTRQTIEQRTEAFAKGILEAP